MNMNKVLGVGWDGTGTNTGKIIRLIEIKRGKP